MLVLLHLQHFFIKDKYGNPHTVHGNTYLHMYGPHMYRKTMMMGMCVP